MIKPAFIRPLGSVIVTFKDKSQIRFENARLAYQAMPAFITIYHESTVDGKPMRVSLSHAVENILMLEEGRLAG